MFKETTVTQIVVDEFKLPKTYSPPNIWQEISGWRPDVGKTEEK